MKKQSSTGGYEIHSLSAISHILEHRPDRILSLRCSTANPAPRVARLLQIAESQGVSIQRDRQKDRAGGEALLVAKIASYPAAEWREVIDSLEDKKTSVVLALDHIQDPQNLGALCRSAEAFGVDAVFLPQARSPWISAAVYQASAGAIETLTIAPAPNLGECLRRLKKVGFWIVGTDMSDRAVLFPEAPKFEKTVLVLGAEGEGLSPLIRDLCDVHIAIPMKGKIQSLNVSAAGAVLMSRLSHCL